MSPDITRLSHSDEEQSTGSGSGGERAGVTRIYLQLLDFF
jgi:hypothetical protein